jgi:hypothetical protein
MPRWIEKENRINLISLLFAMIIINMEQKAALAAVFAIIVALALLSVVIAIVNSVYYTNPALLAARPPMTNGTFFLGCQPNSKPFNASGEHCFHL